MGWQLDSKKCHCVFNTDEEGSYLTEYRDKMEIVYMDVEYVSDCLPEKQRKSDFHNHPEMEPGSELVKPLLNAL